MTPTKQRQQEGAAKRANRRQENAIDHAKLMLGFGDSYGWAGPCDVCGSHVSRTYGGKTRCWWHYDGPLTLELPL